MLPEDDGQGPHGERRTENAMFQSCHNGGQGPPAVVYEPDWAPQTRTTSKKQQHRSHRTPIRGQPYNSFYGQAEAREPYLHQTRDGNSLVVGNDGRVGSPPTAPLSPQHRHQRAMINQYNPPPPNYNCSDPVHRAAVNEVVESMNADGRGNVTALRGLWKVFDAAVNELGNELNDLLSNKAIFEACVVQENMHRNGEKMAEMQKKTYALDRKQQYDAALKSSLLRIRGSFAEVLLSTQKNIQDSIDNSFAVKMADSDKAHAREIAHFQKNHARQAAEMEQTCAKIQKEVERKAESAKQAASLEMQRSMSELRQAEQTISLLNSQLAEQQSSLQRKMAEERDRFTHAIATAERSREETVAKLSSTLETLQSTCNTAQTLENDLRAVESRLNDVETKRHQENETAIQQWNIENERAQLLQTKLDAEIKNKKALISVQKEMEDHLVLERERADLLQQELESQTSSHQEVVASLQQADKHRRDEVDRIHEDNVELRKMLKESKKAESLSTSELKNMQIQYEEQLASLQECEASLEVGKDRLEKTTEMNNLLVSKLERTQNLVDDQQLDLEAARMSEADVEAALAESLQRVEELELNMSQMREETADIASKLTDECKQRLLKISALNEAEEKIEALAKANNATKQECESIKKEAEQLKKKLEKSQANQREYEDDREKIENALAGFDEEMTNTEMKLRSVLDELEKEKIKNRALVEGQTKVQSDVVEERDSLKVKMREASEKFDQLSKQYDDSQEELSRLKAAKVKHEHDVGVYEEAIKLLQKQVAILEGLADSNTIAGDSQIVSDDVEERLTKEREELESRIHEQQVSRSMQICFCNQVSLYIPAKLEHDGLIRKKNADIASLKEKIYRRDESMARLEDLCDRARNDLERLRQKNEYLETNLGRTIGYIKDLKARRHFPSDDSIEIVATPRSDRRYKRGTFDIDDACAPILDATPDLPNTTDLDRLLSDIAEQLDCGTGFEQRRVSHSAKVDSLVNRQREGLSSRQSW